ncbi:putative lipoprotein [Burkholderia mallei]|nr:putative lipoprotein [Burkholderia mallei]KOT01411.1 putative lipoprotein [Burkholderia mallei]
MPIASSAAATVFARCSQTRPSRPAQSRASLPVLRSRSCHRCGSMGNRCSAGSCFMAVGGAVLLAGADRGPPASRDDASLTGEAPIVGAARTRINAGAGKP